jgi:hypothetical protein
VQPTLGGREVGRGGRRATPDDLSDDLRALEQELLALLAEHAAAPVPDGDPAADEARYRCIRGLEARIARAPARTPAEVAVKLRRLAAHETLGGRRAWASRWSNDLMRTALAALDRMGTTTGGG